MPLETNFHENIVKATRYKRIGYDFILDKDIYLVKAGEVLIDKIKQNDLIDKIIQGECQKKI
jgi:hypothetical protein